MRTFHSDTLALLEPSGFLTRRLAEWLSHGHKAVLAEMAHPTFSRNYRESLQYRSPAHRSICWDDGLRRFGSVVRHPRRMVQSIRSGRGNHLGLVHRRKHCSEGPIPRGLRHRAIHAGDMGHVHRAGPATQPAWRVDHCYRRFPGRYSEKLLLHATFQRRGKE